MKQQKAHHLKLDCFIFIFLSCLSLFLFFSVGKTQEQDSTNLESTYGNIRYGPHERNVLDLWKANSEEPTPLVMFIHGGGFRSGSKENISALELREFLNSGISVASINYRLIPNDPLPAAFHDGRQALQFLRSKAKEWNLDKSKVGCFGGSAGAVVSMYLAFHDDMAVLESEDPIERESTRLTCVASLNGPTTMDMNWMKKWIPGSSSLLENDPYYNKDALFAMFNAKTMEEYNKVVQETTALFLITPDDPPIFMEYRMAPDESFPDNPQLVRGWIVHHVMFGVKLKEKMDKFGIEAALNYPGASTKYTGFIQFFKIKFGKE